MYRFKSETIFHNPFINNEHHEGDKEHDLFIEKQKVGLLKQRDLTEEDIRLALNHHFKQFVFY